MTSWMTLSLIKNCKYWSSLLISKFPQCSSFHTARVVSGEVKCVNETSDKAANSFTIQLSVFIDTESVPEQWVKSTVQYGRWGVQCFLFCFLFQWFYFKFQLNSCTANDRNRRIQISGQWRLRKCNPYVIRPRLLCNGQLLIKPSCTISCTFGWVNRGAT